MPLKVVKHPQSSILWLSGTVLGKRIRESTGTNDPRLAEEKRAVREAQLFRSSIHDVTPSRTFAEAALAYLKRERSDDTKVRLNRFLKFLQDAKLQDLRCDQVDQNLIDKAVDAMLRPNPSDATRLREVLSPVRAVLRFAAIRGWCRLPVFERIRQPKRRKEWLTPKEAEAIIAASPRHLAALFEFMFSTGARRGEALSLVWKICPDPVRTRHAA
jgi:integrase